MRQIVLTIFICFYFVPALRVRGEEVFPKMTCNGVTGKGFCCTAEETGGYEPEWQIFDMQEPDRAKGMTACFVAPKEWKAVQMKITDDNGTVSTLTVYVMWSGAKQKVVFAKGIE